MAKEKIILLSTHIVSDIEAIANQLIIIRQGEITETGNIDQLVQGVAGKVWETTVRQDMVNIVSAERAVIHIKQVGKDVQIRFVGEPILSIECRAAMPTLEDYYIYVNENKGV